MLFKISRIIEPIQSSLNSQCKLLPRCWYSVSCQNVQSSALMSNAAPKSSNNLCSLQFSKCIKPFSTYQYINWPEKRLLGNVNDLQQQQKRYVMRLQLSEYGIVWRRPEYVASWKPEKSGDLVPFEEVDKTKPVLAMMPIEKQLSKCDERVQRLLSLEFSNNKEILNMAKYKMKRRIQRHQFDENSLEVKSKQLVASMTVSIRYFQIVVAANKKKVRLRVRLKETIEKRRSMLTLLRKQDYKKFEWLLEELGIIYRPTPKYFPPITRRRCLHRLVVLHCRKLKDEKLAKYRLELETLKRPFLEEKRKTLKWVAETEKKWGLPVSVEVPEEEERGEVKQLESGSHSSKTSEENI